MDKFKLRIIVESDTSWKCDDTSIAKSVFIYTDDIYKTGV